MANVLKKGGADRGGYLEIGCIPDSTFATEIAALVAAKTNVIGKLVSLTWSANYQVTSPADNAIPDGKIVRYEKSGSTYLLTVRLFSYIDVKSYRHIHALTTIQLFFLYKHLPFQKEKLCKYDLIDTF